MLEATKAILYSENLRSALEPKTPRVKHPRREDVIKAAKMLVSLEDNTNPSAPERKRMRALRRALARGRYGQIETKLLALINNNKPDAQQILVDLEIPYGNGNATTRA